MPSVANPVAPAPFVDDSKEIFVSADEKKSYAFLSYAGPDRDTSPHFVATQFMLLHSLDIPVWYDESSIERTGAPNNPEFIQNALLTSKLVVCFVSAEYVKRKWPCLEVVSAYHHNIPIIPVRPPDDYKENWEEHPDFYYFKDERSSSSSINELITVGKLLSRTPGIARKSSGDFANPLVTSCVELAMEVTEKLDCKSKINVCRSFVLNFSK